MTRRAILRYLNAAHFFDHFFLLIFPTAALAIAADWGMSYAATLALGTPLYVAFAAGTLPAGWLGDRFDRLTLIAIFFLGCGAASLAIAAATGPVMLMTGLAALGLFCALYHPVALAVIPDLAERPGRALAINGVFGNMGLAGAALVTGVLADASGWKSAFAVPGIVSLAVGLALALRCRTRTAGTVRADRRPGADTASIARRTQITVFAVICVSALFGGLVFNAVTISLPKFFDERLTGAAGDLTWIGASTGLVFAIAAFAQLPVGELLDRYGARPILVTLIAGQTALLVVLSGLDGWPVVPLAVLLVTMMFASIPISSWLLGHYVRSGLRARAISVEYVLSLGMASAAVPAIAGLHGIGLGFDVQFYLLAGSSAIVFAAAWALPRSGNRAASLPGSPSELSGTVQNSGQRP